MPDNAEGVPGHAARHNMPDQQPQEKKRKLTSDAFVYSSTLSESHEAPRINQNLSTSGVKRAFCSSDAGSSPRSSNETHSSDLFVRGSTPSFGEKDCSQVSKKSGQATRPMGAGKTDNFTKYVKELCKEHVKLEESNKMQQDRINELTSKLNQAVKSQDDIIEQINEARERILASQRRAYQVKEDLKEYSSKPSQQLLALPSETGNLSEPTRPVAPQVNINNQHVSEEATGVKKIKVVKNLPAGHNKAPINQRQQPEVYPTLGIDCACLNCSRAIAKACKHGLPPDVFAKGTRWFEQPNEGRIICEIPSINTTQPSKCTRCKELHVSCNVEHGETKTNTAFISEQRHLYKAYNEYWDSSDKSDESQTHHNLNRAAQAFSKAADDAGAKPYQ